jgi:hypothetical protein
MELNFLRRKSQSHFIFSIFLLKITKKLFSYVVTGTGTVSDNMKTEPLRKPEVPVFCMNLPGGVAVAYRVHE